MINTVSDEFLHIGFDDTDSRVGRCTTHLAFKITSYLLKEPSVEFIDYPLLIRLNPNIPWKTRGNGAVCLRIKAKNHERIIYYIKQSIEVGSAINEGANPTVAFFSGDQIPEGIKRFSRTAMFDILSREKAKKIAKENCIQYFTFGNGQGLVGSLGAIGCLLDKDYTFEVIAYRRPENYGTKRILNIPRVIEYDKHTYPHTFNNYDHYHQRVLIAPHGSDPIFCGIRGEKPEVIVSYLEMLHIQEKLDGYMVFRSNQGTNMHLQNEFKLSKIKPFMAGYLNCKINLKPYSIHGGHVLFAVQDSTGIIYPACVYEPTGLTNIASLLQVGDYIRIGYGVRKATSIFPRILNIEYLHVLELNNAYDMVNPLCKFCNKRMKSEGRNKGFQCPKCKHKEIGSKIAVLKNRNLKTGLYIPTPKSRRHLTKPMHRYGIEKTYFALKDEISHTCFFSRND